MHNASNATWCGACTAGIRLGLLEARENEQKTTFLSKIGRGLLLTRQLLTIILYEISQVLQLIFPPFYIFRLSRVESLV